jgi:hypothetical protein
MPASHEIITGLSWWIATGAMVWALCVRKDSYALVSLEAAIVATTGAIFAWPVALFAALKMAVRKIQARGRHP